MYVHTHSYAHVVCSYTFIRFPYQIFLLFFFFFHSFACSGLVAVMTNSLLSVFPDSKAARWSASAFKSPPRIVVWLTPTKPAASNSACGSNLAQACVRARGRGRRGVEGRMYACELTNTYDPPKKTRLFNRGGNARIENATSKEGKKRISRQKLQLMQANLENVAKSYAARLKFTTCVSSTCVFALHLHQRNPKEYAGSRTSKKYWAQ